MTDTDSAGAPAIRFDAVSCTFFSDSGQVLALSDITLDVPADGVTTIVGPSGCGKSTLLRIASGLLRPTRGQTFVMGTRVDGIRQDIGFVTQDSNLFPWLTTIKNVEFALRVRGRSRRERHETARRYLAMVGLEDFEDSYPSQLSGGMQKRASIARTLAYSPKLLLMDEPFGALDAQNRMRLQDQLLAILAETQKAVMFVTHDIAEAVAISDRVVVMSARPGRIKKVVSVDLPRPRNVYEIHAVEGFAEVYGEIWSTLKDDVLV